MKCAEQRAESESPLSLPCQPQFPPLSRDNIVNIVYLSRQE